MRFLESLLLVFVAIYVAQLVIAALMLATMMLFLWCLWKRPREALVLGLALLGVVIISKPIGFALVATIVAGFVTWGLLSRFRRRRPTLRLTYHPVASDDR
jgi:hypothetical protein